MDVDSSRTIAEDYIRYSLEKNGLSWHNGQRDATPNQIQQAMRAMGDEFETRFSHSFDDMISRLEITPDTAYQTFRTIVTEIFADGVNWGRVVALFGFGGKLSVKCVQQNMPQLVNSIVDWVSDYVDTNLKSWIAANNGWVSVLCLLSLASLLYNNLHCGVAWGRRCLACIMQSRRHDVDVWSDNRPVSFLKRRPNTGQEAAYILTVHIVYN